jgi:hypothetical protein
MYPTNAYVIRQATDADTVALWRLAELDGQRPFDGPALIGEIHGTPAAAISVDEGRVVADPFQPTDVLTQLLRMRLAALRAHSRAPSLRDRLREATAPFRARVATA